MKKAPRKPTYEAAMRFARIAFELPQRPFGWRFDQIERTLGIGERTLARYVKEFKSKLTDGFGRPLIIVDRSGLEPVLKLAQPVKAADSNSYLAASLFFVLTMLRF